MLVFKFQSFKLVGFIQSVKGCKITAQRGLYPECWSNKNEKGLSTDKFVQKNSCLPFLYNEEHNLSIVTGPAVQYCHNC